MSAKRKEKQTFIRQVCLNPEARAEWGNVEHKFHAELPGGVLMQHEVTYTDERGYGFGSPMFAASILREDTELLEHLFIVRRIPKKKTRGKRIARPGRIPPNNKAT